MTTKTTNFKIIAEVLDPDDGEAYIGEVHSGIVLERFESLREAKNRLKKDFLHYVDLAHERLAHA